MEEEIKMTYPKGYILPVSVPCYNFTPDGKENKRVTVIIAPIRISSSNDGDVAIGYACNRGPFCKDPYCRYSASAHANERREDDLC